MRSWSLMVEMRRPARIGLLATSLLLLPVALLQLGHLVEFGHFFPFGLHADTVVRKADYGIPGITKVYEARLTNYGILPKRITVCDFIDDAMSHGAVLGSTVEKLNASGRRWESIFFSDKSAFCLPYPLGMIETHVVIKRLWPSQSMSAGKEATAARGVFAIGDKARFIVFPGGGLAFATAAFSIDEYPTTPDVPYRVRH